MNADVLRYLRCPLCGQPLHLVDAAGTQALRCPARHSFDLARQGYVNLLTGRVTHSGDSPEMVAAREDFLSTGQYDFISLALTAAVVNAVPPTAVSEGAADHGDDRTLVVDVGAGTGRYLAAVLDVLPGAVGLAVDVAKPATRRAARAHPRIGAVLGDVWSRLPVADAAASVLINVFAPRNGAEFRRVLRPDGLLVVVTPAEEHLGELVERLDLLRVDPAKVERVAQSLADEFTPVGEIIQRRPMWLSRQAVWTLVSMGPSAWHNDPVRLAERIAALPEPMPVTAAVRLSTWRPR